MSKNHVVAAALLSAALAFPVGSWAACPTSYTCGLSVAQANIIDNSSNSAKPKTIVGTLSTDATGANVTLNFMTNNNGTLQASTVTGTCSSSGSIGTLTFSSPGFALTFVPTAGNAKILFIGDTSSSSVNQVNAGICQQATPLTACPTSGSCQYTSTGTQALGITNQGYPQVTLGTITFAGATGNSFVGEINDNGMNTPIPATTGTCSFDSTTGVATLDFTGGGGPKIALVAAGAGNYRTIEVGNSVAVGACVP